MHTPPSHRLICPDCQGRVRRVSRRFIDRLAGLFMPVLRYRCDVPACGWQGLLQRPRRGSGHRPGQARYVPCQVLEAGQGTLPRPPAS